MLGRRVENAVLQELLRQAAARGIRRLLGTYLPTEKNKLVEDHYAKLGFTRLDGSSCGGTRWELCVEGASIVTLPIAVQRLGFAPPVGARATAVA